MGFGAGIYITGGKLDIKECEIIENTGFKGVAISELSTNASYPTQILITNSILDVIK